MTLTILKLFAAQVRQLMAVMHSLHPINIVTRSPLASLGTEYGVDYGTQGLKRGTISHSSQTGTARLPSDR